jgi:hypothetical protein
MYIADRFEKKAILIILALSCQGGNVCPPEQPTSNRIATGAVTVVASDTFEAV